MYASCDLPWSFNRSRDITTNSAGCSMRQSGAQPGVAVRFRFPHGKEKLVEMGNQSTCSLCWLEPDRNTLWWYQLKHVTEKTFFFLQSQKEDNSVYVLFIMLFPETLKMLGEFKAWIFLSFEGNSGLNEDSLWQLLRGHCCLVTCWWKREIGNREVLFEAPHP